MNCKKLNNKSTLKKMETRYTTYIKYKVSVNKKYVQDVQDFKRQK